MSDLIEVTTTTANHDQAVAIAKFLVESRLAACVQISGPIQSFYRWQGNVCDEQEYRCTAKSTKQLLPQLESGLLAQHPYDTPEFLVTEIHHASADYADWLRLQVQAET